MEMNNEQSDIIEILPKRRGRPKKEVVEPIEKKPVGRPKTENPKTLTREYYKNYYHDHKEITVCKSCGKSFLSKACYYNHKSSNKTCLILQLLKNNNDNNVNEEELESRALTKFKKLLNEKEDI